MKIIDADDPLLKLKSALPMSGRNLKKLVQAFESSVLCVTSTMPDVYFYIRVDSAKTRTYHMPYRAFLGFVAQLEIEDTAKFDWAIYGF